MALWDSWVPPEQYTKHNGRCSQNQPSMRAVYKCSRAAIVTSDRDWNHWARTVSLLTQMRNYWRDNAAPCLEVAAEATSAADLLWYFKDNMKV